MCDSTSMSRPVQFFDKLITVYTTICLPLCCFSFFLPSFLSLSLSLAFIFNLLLLSTILFYFLFLLFVSTRARVGLFIQCTKFHSNHSNFFVFYIQLRQFVSNQCKLNDSFWFDISTHAYCTVILFFFFIVLFVPHLQSSISKQIDKWRSCNNNNNKIKLNVNAMIFNVCNAPFY